MRSPKVIGLIGTMLVIFAGCAASAVAALPTILALVGGKSILLESHVVSSVKLETNFGTLVSCGLRSLETRLSRPQRLGSLEAYDECAVTGTKEPCSTAGQPAGTMVYEDESQFVFTSLTPLRVGVLFTVPEFTITCGMIKIKVKGSLLAAYTGALNSFVTNFTFAVKGSKGKPGVAKYLNEKAETREAALLVNFGSGFENADIDIEKEIEDKVNQAIEIMG